MGEAGVIFFILLSYLFLKNSNIYMEVEVRLLVGWSVGQLISHNFLKKGWKLHFHAPFGTHLIIPPLPNSKILYPSPGDATLNLLTQADIRLSLIYWRNKYDSDSFGGAQRPQQITLSVRSRSVKKGQLIERHILLGALV